jgi:hypothetical protein
MNHKNQLIKEIEQSSDDFLVEELLDFFLFIKNRRKSNNQELRPYGLCEGEFVTPSDFDQPLPDEIIKQFQ